MSTVSIERVRHLNGERNRRYSPRLEKTIEKIQQRAFSLFEQRGELPGLDREDWLLAEHEVLGSASAELVENDKELKLKVAVPGVESKDVTVTATPESLIVQANGAIVTPRQTARFAFASLAGGLCRQFACHRRSTLTRFRPR